MLLAKRLTRKDLTVRTQELHCISRSRTITKQAVELTVIKSITTTNMFCHITNVTNCDQKSKIPNTHKTGKKSNNAIDVQKG